MEPERREIRFGVVAVQKGFVTQEQVIKALEIQVKEDLATGKHRNIGMILLEDGIINSFQLDDVLQTLKESGL